jgi:hypothetical protein
MRMMIFPKKRHNPRMPQIVPIIKPYNERRGRPSLIKDGVGLPLGGWKIPTNNGVGGFFNIGGSGHLGGGSRGLLGNNGIGPPRGQNLRSYVVQPTRLWIRPTWNLWYPLWYLVQPHVTPNLPPSRKSLPYPIYIMGINLDAHTTTKMGCNLLA